MTEHYRKNLDPTTAFEHGHGLYNTLRANDRTQEVGEGLLMGISDSQPSRPQAQVCKQNEADTSGACFALRSGINYHT